MLAVRVKDTDATKNTGATKDAGANQESGQASSSGSKHLPDYDIDTVIKEWFTKKADGRLDSVCTTDGGWEGWAQLELEQEFKTTFQLGKKAKVREGHVYRNDREAADFVLKADAKNKGMIIELKCENRKTNKGSAMEAKVQTDIKKEKNLKPEYKKYSFIVLAMAYSEEAERVIENLGLTAIEGAEVDQVSSSDESESEGNGASDQTDTLRVYRKEISSGDGVDEITQGVAGLSTGGGNEDKGDNDKTGEAGTTTGTDDKGKGKAGTTTGEDTQGTTSTTDKAGKKTGAVAKTKGKASKVKPSKKKSSSTGK